MNVTTIGLDIAKNVFQVHGVDKAGKTVLRTSGVKSCNTASIWGFSHPPFQRDALRASDWWVTTRTARRTPPYILNILPVIPRRCV